MPASSASVMLAVNEKGYLTPLCTPADLLYRCKAVWRAERA
jgi:hypothetical protein